MYNTNDYRYLIEQIKKESEEGRNALNNLFPLDDGLARAFARLGYCVITTIFELEYDYASNSQINWIELEEKGIYILNDLSRGIYIKEEYEIAEDKEEIKAECAKSIAFEKQVEVLNQDYTIMNSAKFNFAIFPELKKKCEKCYDVTSSITEV